MTPPSVHGERRKTDALALALLRPILRLLFSRGLSRQRVGELCDTLFIEAAAQKLAASENPVTHAAIAKVSGIPLSKVKRLKKVLDDHSKAHAALLAEQTPLTAAAARLITGWYADDEFTDDDGRPLPCRPDSHRFMALLGRYGSNHDPAALVDLLLSTQTVSLNDGGELLPCGRHVLAAPGSAEIAHNALEALVDLARAVEVNQQKRLTGTGALQRTCANDRMPKRALPLFRAMVRQHTQSFLESIDDWLVQHETKQEESPGEEPSIRLGVGVYVIADD